MSEKCKLCLGTGRVSRKQYAKIEADFLDLQNSVEQECAEYEKEIARLRATQPRILAPPFKVEEVVKHGAQILIKTHTGKFEFRVVWTINDQRIGFYDGGHLYLSDVAKIICLPDDLLDGRRVET